MFFPLSLFCTEEIDMNQYITGAMIKRLRENKHMTQQQLASKLNVSDKTISKWENSRGYPDISLIESLANTLDVSIIELFTGENIVNTNKSSNMRKMKFYVCPICGNIIQSTGEAVVSCCGIVLPALEAEEEDIEKIEDEYYVTISHDMNKEHYISFIAAIRDDGYEIKKLYAESSAEARFKVNRTRSIIYYCNRHGLFHVPVR